MGKIDKGKRNGTWRYFHTVEKAPKNQNEEIEIIIKEALAAQQNELKLYIDEKVNLKDEQIKAIALKFDGRGVNQKNSMIGAPKREKTEEKEE